MIQKLPNILTIFRIIVIPIIILSFYFDDVIFAHQFAAILFSLACITDFFDGYVARQFNQESAFGRMLDPIADKLLVAVTLILLINAGFLNVFAVIAAVVIICREIFMSGLREFTAGQQIALPVTTLAKGKTTAQFAALLLLLLSYAELGQNTYLYILAQISLIVAAVLTVITAVDYWRAAKHQGSF